MSRLSIDFPAPLVGDPSLLTWKKPFLLMLMLASPPTLGSLMIILVGADANKGRIIDMEILVPNPAPYLVNAFTFRTKAAMVPLAILQFSVKA